MTQSTNGQICYGVVLDEDIELPWKTDEWEGEIEEWWLAYKGFDRSRSDMKASVFLKANPLPVDLVNYCSSEYPMWVLCVPGTLITAWRGSPVDFDPSGLAALAVLDGIAANELVDFCRENGIDIGQQAPHWILSSYWG